MSGLEGEEQPEVLLDVCFEHAELPRLAAFVARSVRTAPVTHIHAPVAGGDVGDYDGSYDETSLVRWLSSVDSLVSLFLERSLWSSAPLADIAGEPPVLRMWPSSPGWYVEYYSPVAVASVSRPEWEPFLRDVRAWASRVCRALGAERTYARFDGATKRYEPLFVCELGDLE